MPTVIITGGTGLVGRALGQALLEKGYKVIVFTRGENSAISNLRSRGTNFARWNVKEHTIDEAAIAEADYIIHLAGAGIADKRWTKKRKQEIVDSRVKSSQLLADSLKKIPNKVKAVISASAIGWYGPDLSISNPKPFTEDSMPANDFLGKTCKQWEDSIEPVTALGKRLVKIRTGIVLSKDGGALTEFKKPLKFGVAAILGNGKQVISWIHINDLVRIYITAIENAAMDGSYNAVATTPVSNKELTISLAKSRNRFYIPVHVPSFLLKWVLGEMSTEILKSTTVSADKIKATGFSFTFPVVQDALQHT